MAVTLTFHGDRPRDAGDRLIDVLGPQLDDAVAVADDAVSDPVAASGLYRVVASTACTVRFGADGLADATGGEYWPAGHMEVRHLAADDVVAVDALA